MRRGPPWARRTCTHPCPCGPESRRPMKLETLQSAPRLGNGPDFSAHTQPNDTKAVRMHLCCLVPLLGVGLIGLAPACAHRAAESGRQSASGG